MIFALSSFRAGLLLALPLAFALVSPASAQDKNMPTLAVTGEGLVTARPDMAIVTVGVVSQAPRAGDALAQNSKAMTAVIAAVKEAGVDAKDIETSQLSLRPQYSFPTQGSREAPKLVAYEAGNNVSVRMRDLEKLGALLDQLVTSGANQIRGIELTLAEPGPVRDAARVAATKDAMRKADLLAEAAGVRIVRILSITEDSIDSPRPVVMRMQAEAAARAPVPIEAGEQEIRARVSAVFEIAPK